MAQTVILDAKRRNPLNFPSDILMRRGTDVLPGTIEAGRVTTVTRTALLRTLFDETITERLAQEGLLEGDRAFSQSEIEAYIRTLEGNGGFPNLDDATRENLVYWVDLFNRVPADHVSNRYRALRRGCALEEGSDPLFRQLAEQGPSLDFLEKYTDRLFELLDFLNLRQGRRLTELFRRWERGGQQDDALNQQIDELIRTQFSTDSESEFLGVDPRIQRELLSTCSQWLSANPDRPISELVWITLQQFKVHYRFLQQLINARPNRGDKRADDKTADDKTAHRIARLRVLMEGSNIGPEDPREVCFVGGLHKFLPFGQMPGTPMDRRPFQLGEPPLTAYLLVLLERMGNHLVFELPDGMAQLIIDECRRIPARRANRGRSLYEDLYHRLRRASLSTRHQLMSHILFGCDQSELSGDELPEPPFVIRRGGQTPRDAEVYLRLLGFYYVRLLQRTHPHLLKIDGRQQSMGDLLRAFEVSVRLQTDQRGHGKSRTQVRVNFGQGQGPGRLASLLGRPHAEIPRLVLFDELTTLLDLSITDLFRVMTEEPPDTSPGEPPEEPGELPPSEPPEEQPPEPQAPVPPIDPQPPDEPVPEEVPEAVPLTPEERDNILRYRLVYADHFVRSIALSQQLRVLQPSDTLALEKACSIQPVVGMQTPNPFEECREWFERQSLPVPRWVSCDALTLPEERDFDRIDVSITADAPPTLLQQAYDRVKPGGVLDICFPIDPPQESTLEELRQCGELHVLKKMLKRLLEKNLKIFLF